MQSNEIVFGWQSVGKWLAKTYIYIGSNVYIMATISFQPIGTKSTVPIYLRFSISRETNFRVKSGYTINPNNWSAKTGLPKQTTPELKNLKTDLETLRLALLGKCNEATTHGADINKTWAEDQIDIINGKTQKTDLARLTNYFDYYISNLPNKVKRGGTKGVSASTLKTYGKVKHRVEDFEKHQKAKCLVKDVDLKFRDNFAAYLRDVEVLAENYVGRLIKALKTVCLDAKAHGIEVSPQLDQVKGYTVRIKNTYLSPEELEIIDCEKYGKDYLENAKDWLIIGCYLGQRVSDLLTLTRDNITTQGGVEIISLRQVKTGKRVVIPIHPKVDEVLTRHQGGFPRKISDQRFNEYIKEVVRIAGINTPIKGSIQKERKHNGKKIHRKVYGTYPKWELITSHICRRSFATNFYAQEIPTSLLMSVTGHSTERQFLEYIGKSATDYALQMAEYWTKETMNKKKVPQLNVVRKAQ